MFSKRALAVIGAVVMSIGLVAGPAQAASDAGTRHKAHSHIGSSRVAYGAINWAFVVQVKRAGQPYGPVRVQLQYHGKHGWKKAAAMRTDATGYATFVGHSKVRSLHWRVHYDGNRKTAASNSRSYKLNPR